MHHKYEYTAQSTHYTEKRLKIGNIPNIIFGAQLAPIWGSF
jgi:hypothetical protein